MLYPPIPFPTFISRPLSSRLSCRTIRLCQAGVQSAFMSGVMQNWGSLEAKSHSKFAEMNSHNIIYCFRLASTGLATPFADRWPLRISGQEFRQH